MRGMSDSTGLAPASAQDPVRSLEADLLREQKKVALVQEVSRALSGSGDLDTLLELIVHKVTELMEADRSTLYLVWNQGREDFQSTMGDQNFTEDFNDLFHTRPLNTFLVKISYWLTPLAN